MNNSQKSMMYYYHQNEIVRIMRVRLLDSIDNKIDLTPKYNNNIKVGVVIGTYGAIPYIDLQLYYLKNINQIDNILIHDDCSNKQNELKDLAKKYNIDFYSTPFNMFHKSCVGSVGDQNCFYQGLLWGKQKNLDILIKFSRRLIPCYKWIDDFKQLVKDSNGSTFSSYCTQDPFPIRTECFGMNVKSWTNDYTLQKMKYFIDLQFPTFAEYWMDSMAKQIDAQNWSEKYDIWKKNHRIGELYSGYVHWYDLLGTCRFNNFNRHSDVLWHQYSKNEDYLKKLNQIFPGKYKLEDLDKVVEI